jgi:NAD(P)-dependent dehydrogenase (short-subunit alcohol dehydrogenase family)
MASQFVAAGARVVLADIEPEPLEKAVADLRAVGGAVLAHTTDVADPASVEGLAAAAFAAFGDVDIVCNNAGVNRIAPTWELLIEDWQWILGVNLWGVINGIRSFLPHLRQRGTGHIVNTASVAAVRVRPGGAAYTTSKFAVLGLSDSLRADLERDGVDIGVTVVLPGRVSTGIADAEMHRRDGLHRADPEFTARHRAALAERGIAPEVVARQVLDAIRGRRPYVFTHPGLIASALAERAEAMRREFPAADDTTG